MYIAPIVKYKSITPSLTKNQAKKIHNKMRFKFRINKTQNNRINLHIMIIAIKEREKIIHQLNRYCF